MENEITPQMYRKLRLELNHQIENAMEDLKLTRFKLADLYGKHVKGESYTPARITQLVNVYKGHEEKSAEMLTWLNHQIEKKHAN